MAHVSACLALSVILSYLNNWFVVQNLKIASKNLSHSFFSDTCQEINIKMKEKNQLIV